MAHCVYLSLGTNLGDRLANLQSCLALFPPDIRLIQASPVYETMPWGYPDQPAFLNQAVQVVTEFSPLDLLDAIKGIEKKVGRQETFRWGPRLIDIDILFYDSLVLETPDLKIPHPHIQERAFVLVPMVDIAPDFCHPVSGKSMRTLLGVLNTTGIKLFH